MGYFCNLRTLITVLKSTHNIVKLVPLESVGRDESNGTNFRYQLEKMSQQVKKIFRFAIIGLKKHYPIRQKFLHEYQVILLMKLILLKL